MTEQQRYRVVGDNHYHDGERLRTGDVFSPSEDELAAFGHKFEPVGDAEDVDPESESESEAEAEGDEVQEADAEADTEDEAESESIDSDDESDVTESGYEPEENIDEIEDGEIKTDYTRDELEEKSYPELRTLASNADNEDIDGRSSKSDIIDALTSDGTESETGG